MISLMEKFLSGLLILTLITLSRYASAQSSRFAVGLRMTPDGGGGSMKIFVDPNMAIEGQLNAGGVFGFEGQSITAVGLLEYHIPLHVPSWRIFFGGGAHMGSWTHRNDRKNDEFILGVDGIGGVESMFHNIPL